MKKVIVTVLIATSMVSIYAGGKHDEASSNSGSGEHWMSPQSAAEVQNPITSDGVSIERGKKSYFQYCSSCHGATAMGDGPVGASLNPKPANLVAMAGGHPDGDFAWKISNGRGSMPAWKSLMNENQIWDLVNYIQNLKPKGKVMPVMDHSKMNMGGMKGMDHSKMDMDSMKGMDHSKMNMGGMKGNMGHSDSDGHHDAKPKPVVDSHDKPHSH